ncbi:MAG: hypothetical protein ACP5QK_06655 [Myxococcota bacterium]
MKRGIYFQLIMLFMGIAGILLLYNLYISENKVGHRSPYEYSGKIDGPLMGEVKYLNIITNNQIDCLEYGFYIYFRGIDNDDFVIATDSIRNTFGLLSENMVGYRFRFDKVMECKSRIENRKTYLVIAPPLLLDTDD